jgi:hypothetical protein
VTTDEELDLLDQQLRRLKIEYEVFFNNPAKRPPNDVEWKVLSIIRKFSDSPRMSFSQRYRYNSMAQRYAIQSDLWRKKCRIREEGYRRPQDALLSVQGVRAVAEHEVKHHPVYGINHTGADSAAAAPAGVTDAEIANDQPFAVRYSGSADEQGHVASLYKALTEAKKKSGEKVSGNLESFASFVKKKTSEIRKQHSCEAVEYSVEMQDGQVKLKAKAKV